MNDPETPPSDEQLAALMAATEKDAPPPDHAFLKQLRERSLAAFESAGSNATTPTPPITNPMMATTTMISMSVMPRSAWSQRRPISRFIVFPPIS